jgi:hypothetical protein
MSINVVVSSTAAGVSVSGGTAVAITVGGGIGPAGFVVAPGTATNAFGTFQLTAGDGITISTSASQFQIASYGTTAVSSLAPVQSVAGRVGNVTLQAADVTAGTFAIARIPTISYTALANVPATFSPSAHTHSTTDVVSFTSAAAAAAPVQSVAGRSGAVSLAVADVAGLAAVASSGSYTSLQNVPATFAPSAHTHGTADITGISSSFAAASHTHDAAAISSGVLELARIPTIGYTALSGVPATFAPQAHTHSTADVVGLTASFSQVGHVHDYAASVHTHSTADIVGYSSLPAQGGAAGPLVTDGTAASWATRYSVVDPVLVQGAGMTLTRDTAAGSITVAFAGGTSGIVVSSATPQPLGTASAGSSGNASRADHVHLMPSAADVGAAPASHSHDYVQVLNGLTGTVSIAGGAGVTVSTASSSITIAAAGSYVLPTATDSVLGGVKVGSGLTISSGVLSATGGSGEDSLLRSLFVPPAPTGVSASAGNAQAVVSWTAPTVLAQAPVTDYAVQFQPAGGSWQPFTDSVSTATSATVTGLTNGTAYTFKVAATNAVGTGSYSTASSAVTPVAGDALWANVQLLLPGDTSTNDASSYNRSVSAVGGAASSTAQKRWGAGSIYFDGSGDYLTIPGVNIASGDFALEMWFKTASGVQYAQLIGNEASGGSEGFSLLINNNSATGGQVALYCGGLVVSSSSGDWSDDQWHHIAVSRSGSTVRLYLDGSLASTGSSSSSFSSSSALYVAYNNQFQPRNVVGYIDDLRITVGSNRGYTGATIQVPTAAFPDA